MPRRPDGALEHDILAVLWASDVPRSPGEVLSRLKGDLAYTSVATVLGRLQAKGLVARKRSGRAYRYRAVFSEDELAARSLGSLLGSSKDRRAVMSHFVSTLSQRDVQTLRAVLEALDR